MHLLKDFFPLGVVILNFLLAVYFVNPSTVYQMVSPPPDAFESKTDEEMSRDLFERRKIHLKVSLNKIQRSKVLRRII